MRNPFLLQIKFLLVEFLNVSYLLVPNPIRRFYLFLFGIRINKGSSIHRGCKFFHVGKFHMDTNSVINFGCYIDNRRGIIIGKNVGIAHNTKIYTLGHNIESPKFETKGASVIIEDYSFIFSNVLIMPGIIVHRGAIVLPGSVVVKDVPEWTIVGGNPATPIRKRNPEVDYNQRYNYWFAL